MFLNRVDPLNNPPGGSGGDGPAGDGGGCWFCEKTEVEMHKNEMNSEIITRYFSFAK